MLFKTVQLYNPLCFDYNIYAKSYLKEYYI